jgi:lysine 2,3-aminomutase
MYMVDAPGGGGKIPLSPDYVVGRKDGDLLLRGYNGRLYRYPEMGGPNAVMPKADPP